MPDSSEEPLAPEHIDRISAVVHAAMSAFKLALGEAPLPVWADAGADMQESTRAGVMFRLENPHAAISAQHDQWMAERKAAGWVYGARKDVAARTHPSLVPYEELSRTERQKDALFAAIVKALS